MTGPKIRLFRLWGIEFQIDASSFIIFGLMTFSLASQFAGEYPHWAGFRHWVVGIVTSALFFASIIFHEIAHSLVARVNGLQVRSITLFILGGISQIGREAQRPGTEFLVAIAGPAASIGLACLFGVTWLLTRAHSEILGAVAEWLSQINLVLVIFN